MAFPGLLTMSPHKFTSPATVFSSTEIADALLVIPVELSRMDEEMSTGVCFYTSERSPYAGGSIVCARRFPLWNFESSFERLLNVDSGWGRGACVLPQGQTHTQLLQDVTVVQPSNTVLSTVGGNLIWQSIPLHD